MATVKRLVRLVFGLFLYALGIVFSVQGNVGLAPWDAFHQGISLKIGIPFGTVSVLMSVVIMGVVLLLKEKIGVGTILNSVLIGTFVNIIQGLNLIPMATRMIPGILLLLLGQVCICVSTYFYVGAAWGSGPRDSLMVALAKRAGRVPVGVIRGVLEGAVLLIGWLLGAKVGIGTVIAVFGIGFILQVTFRILHFDIKAVEHESLIGTWARIRAYFAQRSKASSGDSGEKETAREESGQPESEVISG